MIALMATPAPPSLTVTVASDDTAHVVRAAGELDVSTREELQSALDGLAKPPQIVALDFTDLAFVDSTGLAAVLKEHHRARDEGYELVVVGATGPVRDAFRLTAMDITLPMADDLKAVLSD
jgi:anti-sigma B factor antagonist